MPHITTFDSFASKGVIQPVADGSMKWDDTKAEFVPSESRVTDTDVAYGPSESRVTDTDVAYGPSESRVTDTDVAYGPSESRVTDTDVAYGPSESRVTDTDVASEHIGRTSSGLIEPEYDDLAGIPCYTEFFNSTQVDGSRHPLENAFDDLTNRATGASMATNYGEKQPDTGENLCTGCCFDGGDPKGTIATVIEPEFGMFSLWETLDAGLDPMRAHLESENVFIQNDKQAFFN